MTVSLPASAESDVTCAGPKLRSGNGAADAAATDRRPPGLR
jgi:hypothetical protein